MAAIIMDLGLVVAIVAIVAASIPLCCGKMLEHRKNVATFAVAGGLFAVLSPAIEAVLTGAPPVGQDDGPGHIQIKISLFAWIIMCYVVGIVQVILGIIALSLGLCDFCGCCEAKYAAKAREPLIGQPVYEQLADNEK